MRLPFIISFCVILACSSSRFPDFDPDSFLSVASQDDFRVAATYFEPPAGGQYWELQIINADLYLRMHDLGTGGSYQKHIQLSTTRIQEIRNIFQSSKFFELPKYWDKSCCYEDGLSLAIWAVMDGKKIGRELEEPKLSLTSPETKRFLTVWNSIFSEFSNHPKW